MIGILNNEALGLIAINSVLNKKSRLDIAHSYIIIPLLFDKKIRNYLKRKNTAVLSAQEIVTAKSDYFIGFNDKFFDTLIVTTNAIAMGIELEILKLDNGYLIENKNNILDGVDFGNKIEDMRLASENVSVMLSDSPESLYSLLRIEV